MVQDVPIVTTVSLTSIHVTSEDLGLNVSGESPLCVLVLINQHRSSST